jgi:hypothetical protein
MRGDTVEMRNVQNNAGLVCIARYAVQRIQEAHNINLTCSKSPSLVVFSSLLHRRAHWQHLGQHQFLLPLRCVQSLDHPTS